MSSPVSKAIEGLSSTDASVRSAAATQVYRAGRSLADHAVTVWLRNPGLSSLLGPEPMVTVGVAVLPAVFARIRAANANPPLAQVPPDQDAEEFELHFPENVLLDILTTRAPGGPGAISRFLLRFGEGIQQVELRCANIDRATTILNQDFGLAPVYPQQRLGANGSRVNFFLVPIPDGGRVLIELYSRPESGS